MKALDERKRCRFVADSRGQLRSGMIELAEGLCRRGAEVEHGCMAMRKRFKRAVREKRRHIVAARFRNSPSPSATQRAGTREFEAKLRKIGVRWYRMVALGVA